MESLPSIVPNLSTLPNPLSALNQLLREEEKDSKNRIKVSRLGWWKDVKRIKGSTVPSVWRAVLGFTLWSVLVAIAEFVYNKQLGLSNNVTPLLSVVVALLLVFRNTSAYARWEEGRKSFGSMISLVRSLSRSVWINTITPSTITDPVVIEHDRQAKIDSLRLMVAFVVSVKHHIRQEYGTDFEDLRSVLPETFFKAANTSGFGYDAAIADHIPTTSSNFRQGFPEAQASEFNRLSRNEESPFNERRPLLRTGTSTSQRSTESLVILSNYLSKPSLPLPLIIAHQLGLFLTLAKRKGMLESVGPAGYNALQQSLTGLVDIFTSVERLSTIGIPTVYGIHLKQCVSLFLFTLPFTLVEIMRWKMIPFVTLTAFTLIGIESIASETEFPFGIDSSDLPLDLMCAELRNEVEHTISRLSTQADDWM